MTPTTETRLRVRYAETDQMGVVYYANYLVWMEVGRVELCKACGFSYRDMENSDGVLLAVAEAQCRYRAPARFDDEVIVKTWIAEANPRMVTSPTKCGSPRAAANWPPGRPSTFFWVATCGLAGCRRSIGRVSPRGERVLRSKMQFGRPTASRFGPVPACV